MRHRRARLTRIPAAARAARFLLAVTSVLPAILLLSLERGDARR